MPPPSILAEFDLALAKQVDGRSLGQLVSSLCASGHGRTVCDLLAAQGHRYSDDPIFWRLLALAARDAIDPDRAIAAARHSASLAPADPGLAILLAQLSYEAGLPSVDLFQQVLSIDPANKDAIRNLAMAMASEGRADEGDAMLSQALDAQPDWMDGQHQLATLRQLRGDDRFDRGYSTARSLLPRHAPLAMAHFQLLAKCRQWVKAQAVLDAANATMGSLPAFRLSHLFLASESGDAADDASLFDEVAHLNDPGLALARARHALRGGRPDLVEPIIAPLLASPDATTFYPYASLAWRLLGDARAEWIDRPTSSIASVMIDWSEGDIAALASYLRSLHTMVAPYADQSVRGGTQTDRPLLFRAHPLIARLRSSLREAMRGYVDRLPSPVAGHPLLGQPRGEIDFAGSWSVRLTAQGYHACHTHPQGWISSALYVALPEPQVLGPAPAGWLQFGTPPPDLRLDLQPYAAVEPKVGTLALFPSTMWHGTVPFTDGERLTVAFDVRPPRW